jgi:hypothetical protein
MKRGMLMRVFLVFAACALVFAVLPGRPARAAVPNIINFQGSLTDASGNALGGTTGANYDFKFSIWDSATVGAGTRLWPASAPASTTLKVTNGVFSAGLGDTNAGFAALNLSFNSSTPYYL